MIERHITLNHNQKGSDHTSSLEPCEFKLMVQRIRTLEIALGTSVKQLQSSEMSCYIKLRKSLVVSRAVSKGHKLKGDDLKVKVAEPIGIDASLLDKIIGKVAKKNMQQDETLTAECLY